MDWARPGRIAIAVEMTLWVTAAACLASLACAAVIAWHASRAADQFHPSIQPASSSATENSLASGTSSPRTQSKTPPEAVTSGSVIGRVEIPALRLSVPITAGVDPDSLLRGVGHIDGTALPGGLGTVGLAGHRDTYLRPLERVAVGMDIRLVVKTGVYHYHIDRWEIVTPEKVEVLSIRSEPELALITCYPFRFIGPAPRRFVVHAHLVSVEADSR
jgi:sortase A